MEPVNTARYFIAILLPSEITAEARNQQEDFKNRFSTKAALRSPPHITLHMPFRWKIGKEDKLVLLLTKFFGTLDPFQISLDGFGVFPPRVIFINVVASKELMDCQRQLSRFCKLNLGLFNATRQNQPFHPHVTLAFRDLKKPAFKLAWEEYRNRSYLATLDVGTAWLLQHDGFEWHPKVSFSLRNALH